MEKEKLTIEQIVEAVKENRIAYDKEKIIAALILIDKEKRRWRRDRYCFYWRASQYSVRYWNAYVHGPKV